MQFEPSRWRGVEEQHETDNEEQQGTASDGKYSKKPAPARWGAAGFHRCVGHESVLAIA